MIRKIFMVTAVAVLTFLLPLSGSRVAEAATVYDIEPIYSLPSTIPGYAEAMDDIDFDVDPGTRTKDYENFLRVVQKELELGKGWEKLDVLKKKVWQWGKLLGKGGLYGIAGAFGVELLIYGGVALGAMATGEEWNDFYCGAYKNNGFINSLTVTINVDCNFGTTAYEDLGKSHYSQCFKLVGVRPGFTTGDTYCFHAELKQISSTYSGEPRMASYLCVLANGEKDTAYVSQPFALIAEQVSASESILIRRNIGKGGGGAMFATPQTCGSAIDAHGTWHSDWWVIPPVIVNVEFIGQGVWESPNQINEVTNTGAGTDIFCEVRMSDDAFQVVHSWVASGDDVVVGVSNLCSSKIEEMTVEQPDEVVVGVTGGKIGLEEAPIIDVNLPDSYKTASQQYPLCARNACKLILSHKVGTAWVSCFVDPVPCAEWYPDRINNPTDWQCKFGTYVVAISECGVYQDTFKPTTTTGTPITDPETGTTTTVKTVSGTDNELGYGGMAALDRGQCWTQWGAEIMENLLNIVLTPVKCALAWAFVPDPALAPARVDTIKAGANGTVVASVMQVSDNFSNTIHAAAGFAGGSGCAGIPFHFKAFGVDAHLGNLMYACDGAIAPIAQATNTVASIAVWSVAGLTIVRYIASALGFIGLGQANYVWSQSRSEQSKEKNN